MVTHVSSQSPDIEVDVHIRKARHQELTPAVDSLSAFRNADRSHRTKSGDAAIFCNYGLMRNEALVIHRDYGDIDKYDGSLLSWQADAIEKNAARKSADANQDRQHFSLMK